METPPPLPKRVTLRDIAARLDVSYATVSRALNDKADPFISAITRERAREMAREMGYRPNQAARSLLTGKTGLLGLWLYAPLGGTSYHDAVARTMSAAARAHGRSMVADPISPLLHPGGEAHAFDRWHVDGIVAHEAALALEGEPRPPVPLVATGAFGLVEGVDGVKVDFLDGARDAMDHLFAGGRRDVVYVTGEASDPASGERYEAYAEVMAGHAREPRLVNVPSSRQGAREGIKAHIERRGLPDALFCHNDDLALGAYRGLCDLGVRVPDDVALVGCDGIDDLEYLAVPITTVAQPLDAMCGLAFSMLESRLAQPDRPLRHERLKARLVVRASSGG